MVSEERVRLQISFPKGREVVKFTTIKGVTLFTSACDLVQKDCLTTNVDHNICTSLLQSLRSLPLQSQAMR